MQKRGLFLLILIGSIGFVSAQTNIGDILDTFGGENILLIGTFLISFVLINFILSRLPFFIKDKYTGERNRGVPAVIALIISLFIVYGINRFDFDLSYFFFNIGISTELLETVVTFVTIGGVIYLFAKFKRLVFLISGLLLSSLAIFTDWIYNADAILTIGIILIVIWAFLKIIKRFPRKNKGASAATSGYPSYPSYTPSVDYESERRAQRERERYEKERRKREKESLEAIRKEEAYKRQLEEQEARRKGEKGRIAQRFRDIRKQKREELATERGKRLEEFNRRQQEEQARRQREAEAERLGAEERGLKEDYKKFKKGVDDTIKLIKRHDDWSYIAGSYNSLLSMHSKFFRTRLKKYADKAMNKLRKTMEGYKKEEKKMKYTMDDLKRKLKAAHEKMNYFERLQAELRETKSPSWKDAYKKYKLAEKGIQALERRIAELKRRGWN